MHSRRPYESTHSSHNESSLSLEESLGRDVGVRFVLRRNFLFFRCVVRSDEIGRSFDVSGAIIGFSARGGGSCGFSGTTDGSRGVIMVSGMDKESGFLR